MSGGGSHRWPVVRYATIWLVAGFLAAGVVVVAVRGASQPSGQTSDARRADVRRPAETPTGGCVARRDSGQGTLSALRAIQPPTLGPPATPARSGVHTRPPGLAALVGALRRGYIVVQYRPTLDRRLIRRLNREFGSGSPPTVVTPDASGMRFAIAVTAWSRVLGCASADGAALDAAQDFRRFAAARVAGASRWNRSTAPRGSKLKTSTTTRGSIGSTCWPWFAA